jgi:hypothetical protein
MASSEAQASTTNSAKTILFAGLGAAAILIVVAFTWSEARAIALSAGILAAFLGFGLSQAAGLLARALHVLQVEKPKDQTLEITLQALLETLSTLPEKVESGLTGGLNRQGEALGASLSVELKRSAGEVDAALGHARNWIQSQGEQARQENAQLIATWRETLQGSVQSALEAHLKTTTTALVAQHEKSLAASVAGLSQQFAQVGKGLSAEVAATLETSQRKLETGLAASLASLTEATQAHGAAVANQTAATVAQAESLARQSATLKATAETQGDALLGIAETARTALQQAADGISQSQAEQAKAALEWQAGLAEATAKAVQEIGNLSQSVVREITGWVEQSQAALAAQTQAAESVAGTLATLGAETGKAQQALAQFETSAQINQVELQSGVAMLNSALGNVLDRLEGQAQAGESQEAFLAKLDAALAAYQERSGEILTENALKTQEILLEALQALENRATAAIAEGESPLA